MEPASERQAGLLHGCSGATEDYRNDDLTFIVQVFHDHTLARGCLSSLSRVFSGARVVLIADGDADPRHARLAARFGAEYRLGEWLFGIEHGGRVVQRVFDAFLERPTRWLFRIDTDTRAHRRFRWLPVGACVFGTLEHFTEGHRQALDPPVVQGGCLGFTREAVEQMHAARLFQNAALRDWAATWATTRDARERAANGRVSFDHLVRWGYRELGLPPREFDEVRSRWRVPVRNPGRYALTHPHKLWWQWPGLLASLWVSRFARVGHPTA